MEASQILSSFLPILLLFYSLCQLLIFWGYSTHCKLLAAIQPQLVWNPKLTSPVLLVFISQDSAPFFAISTASRLFNFVGYLFINGLCNTPTYISCRCLSEY